MVKFPQGKNTLPERKRRGRPPLGRTSIDSEDVILQCQPQYRKGRPQKNNPDNLQVPNTTLQSNQLKANSVLPQKRFKKQTKEFYEQKNQELGTRMLKAAESLNQASEIPREAETTSSLYQSTQTEVSLQDGIKDAKFLAQKRNKAVPTDGLPNLYIEVAANINQQASAEQQWRSDILKINLRINGKVYLEAFSRTLDLDLNLILYLVKFLKMPPETASRAVFFKQYCLFRQSQNEVLHQPLALKLIENEDTLDIIHYNQTIDLAASWNKMEPQTYVQNPFGGFHIDFLNRYVNDYLKCPIGKSQQLIKRLPWADIQKLDGDWLDRIYETTDDALTKIQIEFAKQTKKSYNRVFMFDMKSRHGMRRLVQRPEREFPQPQLQQLEQKSTTRSFNFNQEAMGRFGCKYFSTMETFFDFVNMLEDESQEQLVILDFTGGFKGNLKHYHVVCGTPGCNFKASYSVIIEFRNDMKCHFRLEPAHTYNVTHSHSQRDLVTVVPQQDRDWRMQDLYSKNPELEKRKNVKRSFQD